MPVLPETLVIALSLLAIWAAQEVVVESIGALADGTAPLDDAVLIALV